MIVPLIIVGIFAICFPKAIGAILKIAFGCALIFAAAMIV